MSFEKDKIFQAESLQRLYRVYGQDETKWGWVVDARFNCRAERGEGLLASELKADLKLGRKICPFKNRIETITTPHPAGNTAGVIAARDFPDKCPICGLVPVWQDFKIE